MKKTITRIVEAFLVIEENRLASIDLCNRLNILEDLIQIRTPNVPAGLPNGQVDIIRTISNLKISLKELIEADLSGKVWR